jgi:polysaccharide export outer membrane protein
VNSRRSLLGIWLVVVGLLCLSLNAQAQDRQPEYQIGAGDSIRITVFQNPDLTVETRVTENGTISYPLIGSVRIGGLTLPAAERLIANALREGNFIQQPQVNIALLQNRGNQVSVLGMVTRPGRFPLETFNTRLSEMLAIAGGIAPSGADVAILTGIRDGKPVRKVIDIPAMFLDNTLDQDVVVAGGDVIYVHRQPMYYIYGEVQRPGSYRVERAMTIRQALAQAGGPSPRGTERRLGVYRRAASGQMETLDPELNDAVQPDDVLYVRDSLF